MANNISGFSYVHNALDGGYPIVEVVRAIEPFVDEFVVVDADSTDDTRKILSELGVTVISAPWGGMAGETLRRLHSMHADICKYDIIIHAEADEVWEHGLLVNTVKLLRDHAELTDYGAFRIQVEQNFQRIREYPTPVHRVYKRGSVIKDGRSTNRHNEAHIMPQQLGMIWDVTNCFRDCWENRVKQNAELWGEEEQYRRVPRHFVEDHKITNIAAFLKQDHWTFTHTPIRVPPPLLKLVGQTRYMGRV